MKYEAISRNIALFDVRKMCEVFGVKRSNYYRWFKNQEKKGKKEEAEKENIKLVTEIFESSDRIWGYRNIYKEIRSRGLKMSEYRIRKIMRENGLYPELAVKFKPQRNGKADGRYYKNIVEQQFKVKEKNRLRAGDITYLKTGTG
jgi:transposase InsO family protein